MFLVTILICVLPQLYSMSGDDGCGKWEYRQSLGGQCAKCMVCDSLSDSSLLEPGCQAKHPLGAYLNREDQLPWCHHSSKGPPMCSPLNETSGGEFRCTDGWYLGSQCQLLCHAGHDLHGFTEYLQCQEDGTWDHALMPSCRSTVTPNLEDDFASPIQILFGFVVFLGVIATLSCAYFVYLNRRKFSACVSGSVVSTPSTSESSVSAESDLEKGQIDGDDLTQSLMNSQSIKGQVAGNDVTENLLYSKNEGQPNESDDVTENLIQVKDSVREESARIVDRKVMNSTGQSPHSSFLTRQETDEANSEAACSSWHRGYSFIQLKVYPGYHVPYGGQLKISLKPYRDDVTIGLVLWKLPTGEQCYDETCLEISRVDESHEGWYHVVAHAEGCFVPDTFWFIIKVTREASLPITIGMSDSDFYDDDLPNRNTSNQMPHATHTQQIHCDRLNIPVNSLISVDDLSITDNTAVSFGESGPPAITQSPISHLTSQWMELTRRDDVPKIPIQEASYTSSMSCGSQDNLPAFSLSNTSQSILDQHAGLRKSSLYKPQGLCEGDHYDKKTPGQCCFKLEDLVNNLDAMKHLSVVMETMRTADGFVSRYQSMDHVRATRNRHTGRRPVTPRLFALVCQKFPGICVGSLVEFLESKGCIQVLQVIKHYHTKCVYCQRIYLRHGVEARASFNNDPKEESHSGHKYHRKDVHGACKKTLQDLVLTQNLEEVSRRLEAHPSCNKLEALAYQLGGMCQQHYQYIRYHHQEDEFVTQLLSEVTCLQPYARMSGFLLWLVDNGYLQSAQNLARTHSVCGTCRNIVNADMA